MVLENQRGILDIFLMPVVKHCKNVNPNVISFFGLVFAFLSGVSLALSAEYYLLLAVGLVCMAISAYFDALDGKIAKVYGKCSKKGDYYDHVFDRFADVFMIGGMAISGWCNLMLGTVALVAVLLTSYMGTQAQAVGQGRMYRGLLGRADRLVITFVFVLLQLIFVYAANGNLATMSFELMGYAFTISWLDISLIWFSVAGVFTVIQRLVITLKNFPDE